MADDLSSNFLLFYTNSISHLILTLQGDATSQVNLLLMKMS